MSAPNVSVNLKDGRSYDIVIDSGLMAKTGDYVAPLLKRKRVVIITDKNVAKLHLESLRASLSAKGINSDDIILAPGEQSKSFAVFENLLNDLLALEVERSDVIIALGGGVIGDLTGFAASVLRRGIDFVQIPTTLLAQVDSSVGGKTGINTVHGKNLVGSFHQPRLVLADSDVLKTLPARELRAGYAEVVKYGLIRDAEFFTWLEGNGAALLNGDTGARQKAVVISCKHKADIVEKDETEKGERALLNFGHTFGHALEAATGYSDRLLHGEAVAMGMLMAFSFSARLKFCAAGDVERVAKHLTLADLPTHPRDIQGAAITPDELVEHIRQDKKVVNGRITFVLTRGIGKAFLTNDVSEQELLNFLTAYGD